MEFKQQKVSCMEMDFFAVSSYAIIEEITLAIFLGVYETRTYVWKCAEILKYSLI